MQCDEIQFTSGVKAIVCRSGMPRCKICGRPSEFQCDFPIGKYKSGKKKGETRTCDKHVCRSHVHHGVTKGVDFCSEHYPIALRAYKRRIKEKADARA